MRLESLNRIRFTYPEQWGVSIGGEWEQHFALAAIVMVAVFSIFITLGILDFKMMGVGLRVAILLDATVVRAVLLPATMSLLGDWNWYLPRWLEWLPKLSAETPVEAKKEQLGVPPALIPG